MFHPLYLLLLVFFSPCLSLSLSTYHLSRNDTASFSQMIAPHSHSSLAPAAAAAAAVAKWMNVERAA
jgi:hypothetical protein